MWSLFIIGFGINLEAIDKSLFKWKFLFKKKLVFNGFFNGLLTERL